MTLGRFVAYCVHPVAAWRRLSKSDRTMLVAAYASAGYVVTLVTLLVA